MGYEQDRVRHVFVAFGAVDARRAEPLDPTEEYFFLSPSAYRRIDVAALTNSLMDALPHTKIAVLEADSAWKTVPI